MALVLKKKKKKEKKEIWGKLANKLDGFQVGLAEWSKCLHPHLRAVGFIRLRKGCTANCNVGHYHLASLYPVGIAFIAND